MFSVLSTGETPKSPAPWFKHVNYKQPSQFTRPCFTLSSNDIAITRLPEEKSRCHLSIHLHSQRDGMCPAGHSASCYHSGSLPLSILFWLFFSKMPGRICWHGHIGKWPIQPATAVHILLASGGSQIYVGDHAKNVVSFHRAYSMSLGLIVLRMIMFHK